jgi:uncharacterized protein YodC (DUF2158 family)
MNDFKIGQVVMLNSGSPKMTISNLIANDIIECTWFNETQELRIEQFSALLLKPIPPIRRGRAVAI